MTKRAKRWPFIQQFSGQPDGVARALRAARAFEMHRLNLYEIEQRGELVFDTSPADVTAAFHRAHPEQSLAREPRTAVGATLALNSFQDQSSLTARTLPLLQDEADEKTYPEGAARYGLHLARERDTQAGRDKKRDVLRRTGVLECEVCSFDFSAVYGQHGLGFLEAHHTAPLHTVEDTVDTTMADLALVCANCHRMLHRGPNLLTIKDLRSIYRRRLKRPSAQ